MSVSEIPSRSLGMQGNARFPIEADDPTMGAIRQDMERWVPQERELSLGLEETVCRAEAAADRVLTAYAQCDTILSLRGLRLVSLPHAIMEIRTLLEIDLSYNIISVAIEMFADLPLLAYLNLSHNRLSSHNGASLTSGECVLRVGNGSSVSFPYHPFRALKRLDLQDSLSFYRDSSLGWIRHIPLLESVDLRKNALDTSRFSLLSSALQKIDLECNELDCVPPSLMQLRGLRILFLGHNRISKIPPEIGKLYALVSVGFQANRLEDLPEEMGALSRLEILSIAGNRCSTLPSALSRCPLKKLVLSANAFEVAPEVIAQLSRLQELFLDNNPHLATLPEGWVQRLPHLMCLSAQGTKVPSEYFVQVQAVLNARAAEQREPEWQETGGEAPQPPLRLS